MKKYNSKFSKVIELYKNKIMTREQILKENQNLDYKTLYKIIKHHQIPFWDLKKNYEEIEVEKIKQLASEGKSKIEISAELKCSYTKVKNFCNKYNIYTIPARQKKGNPERDKLIVQKYQEGKSIKEIARNLSVTFQCVYQVLKKHGVIKTEDKQTKNEGKYYEPKADSSSYAKLFYEFNK